MGRKISLNIPIDPQPKRRPRFSGHAYTDSKTRAYEKQLKQSCIMQLKGFLRIEGAAKVKVVFFLRKPKSSKRQYPSVRPDLDNYEKSILDALNEVAFKDDGQVVDMHSKKLYGDPGIHIEIEELRVLH